METEEEADVDEISVSTRPDRLRSESGSGSGSDHAPWTDLPAVPNHRSVKREWEHESGTDDDDGGGGGGGACVGGLTQRKPKRRRRGAEDETKAEAAASLAEQARYALPLAVLNGPTTAKGRLFAALSAEAIPPIPLYLMYIRSRRWEGSPNYAGSGMSMAHKAKKKANVSDRTSSTAVGGGGGGGGELTSWRSEQSDLSTSSCGASSTRLCTTSTIASATAATATTTTSADEKEGEQSLPEPPSPPKSVTYASIITAAILSDSGSRMRLRAIYDFIEPHLELVPTVSARTSLFSPDLPSCNPFSTETNSMATL
jgi:hypothetical protein